jgi:SPP1 family predicted phage head-tail adaptor
MRHYRHRIEIQAPTEAENDFGETVETFATVDTVWGRLEPVGSDEKFEAGSQVQVDSFTCEMWYRANTTTNNRLRHMGRDFEITGVVNVGELNRKLLISCRMIDDAD